LAQVSKSNASRVIGHSSAMLPDGQIVPLGDLIADAEDVRLDLIKGFLREHDRVTRRPDGRVEVAELIPHTAGSKAGSGFSLVQLLQNRLGKKGNSRATVEKVMSTHGIPWTVEDRKALYEKGEDWWSWS
jgi:hypothetical protein